MSKDSAYADHLRRSPTSTSPATTDEGEYDKALVPRSAPMSSRECRSSEDQVLSSSGLIDAVRRSIAQVPATSPQWARAG